MSIRSITLFGTALTLALGSFAAAAGDTQRVSCEKRVNRSKASVDGKRLPAGNYYAKLDAMDGTPAAQSNTSPAVAGEVEFDFDSNNNDIVEGATPISAGFISGTQVTGSIYNAANNALVFTKSADCRVRAR